MLATEDSAQVHGHGLHGDSVGAGDRDRVVVAASQKRVRHLGGQEVKTELHNL